MTVGSVEAVFEERRLHSSRVTFPNIPLPLTFPTTVRELPTGCPSSAIDETSSHMTLSFARLLKTTLDFLISATTPVTVTSEPLREACEPLLNAAIRESAEYDVSWARAITLSQIRLTRSTTRLPTFVVITGDYLYGVFNMVACFSQTGMPISRAQNKPNVLKELRFDHKLPRYLRA